MNGNNFVGTSDAMLATRFQAVAAVRDLSNVDMARTLEVSAPAVTKWLRTGRIGRIHLIEFCDAYAIDLKWMLTGLGEMQASANDSLVLLPAIPLNRAEVIDGGLIACTTDAEAGRLAYHRQNDNPTFVIQITDTSMAPGLLPGSFLFFEKVISDADLAVGSIVAVALSGRQELFIRRLEEPFIGKRLFAPDNQKHPSIDGDTAQVLGVCVECRSRPS
ncbi:S24 family peptidase [Marinobacter alkaliphilus]|uniref:S24 family peptidase n=1 Tax=Marinobacter alkaliphilus TaxID=254719 RepID=A0ABZ3E977_9GAMM